MASLRSILAVLALAPRLLPAAAAEADDGPRELDQLDVYGAPREVWQLRQAVV